MNREIKFRAWNTLNNEMWDCDKLVLCGLYLATSGAGVIDVDDDRNKQNHIIPLQFTGLKDKNGIEIYEGDIVQWSDEYDYCLSENEIVKAVVKFSENDTLGWHFGKLRKLTGDKLWCDLVPYSMEVIGNIYQNEDILTIEK